MLDSNASPRNLIRTIIGATIGAVIAIVCWIVLFLLATLDDAAHWKGSLILTGFLLPLMCVVCGVIVTRHRKNRLNFVVANIGLSVLATLITSAGVMVLLSLPLLTGLLVTIPVFFAWAFFGERFLSAIINSWVERLAGPPSFIDT